MVDTELQQLLRLHPEPYIYYDDAAVFRALTVKPAAYLDYLKTLLKAIAHNEVALELPPKAVFADPGSPSDFRVMPCVIRLPDRVRKTVKIIGTNWPREVVPGEISVGRAFALHATENFIEAGFAACILSSARTGACAAMAMRLLAPDAGRVAIIGAGRVGYFAGLYAAALGRAEQIVFSDTDRNRAVLAGKVIARQFPELDYGTFDADALDSDAERPIHPDVLILATDSETTLFDASGHRPRLVISVGADTDWQREVDPAATRHYPVVVDTLDSLNWGDLKYFRSLGLLDRGKVLDFNALWRDQSARPETALVVSTGSALFDNLTIDYLLTQGLPDLSR